MPVLGWLSGVTSTTIRMASRSARDRRDERAGAQVREPRDALADAVDRDLVGVADRVPWDGELEGELLAGRHRSWERNARELAARSVGERHVRADRDHAVRERTRRPEGVARVAD